MKRPEQLIQQGIFKNLIPLMKMQKHKEFIAFQIRNETGVGGKQGMILGAIAKSMGTMAGVSDIGLLFPQKTIERVDLDNPVKSTHGEFYPIVRSKIPPKIVFTEIKCYTPLKTKKLDPLKLLNDDQKLFKDRVEAMGFEYRIIAAQNIPDGVSQMYAILKENGVNVLF